MPTRSNSVSLPFQQRVEALFRSDLEGVFKSRNQAFAWLMAIQWVFGVVIAFVYSPYTWVGKVPSTHIHVYYAFLLGGLLSGTSIALIRLRPAWTVTRHVVAIAQMLWSALLIHLMGGRIEAHFHVFGSLAFLAFYRDWKILITATIVVASDHLLRGLFWAESVYGIANPEWWRFLEHVFWVLFENSVLIMATVESLREMRATAARQIEIEVLNENIEKKVVERTLELEASREQYRLLVETTQTMPYQWHAGQGRFIYVGPQAEQLLGCPVDDWLHPDFFMDRLHPDDVSTLIESWKQTSRDKVTQFEFRLRHNDGSWVWIRSIVNSEMQSDDEIVRGVFLDETAHRRLSFELEQARKLESVGRLAAGIAHEINTPIQFISDSVYFMRDAFVDMGRVLNAYGELRTCAASHPNCAASIASVESTERDADLPFVLDNVPKAIERCIDGTNRVATIVHSMKEFSHPSATTKSSADINHALMTTLTIARNEYKYVADIETDFGDLPPVYCYINELNQAFLNIVVNAAHAIADVVKDTGARGRITVRTYCEDESVVVSIADTGNGIPENVRGNVFDPFFTTKEIGKGTGQGLPISRYVVVEKHGGSLTFETRAGEGTTFFVRLPMHEVRE